MFSIVLTTSTVRSHTDTLSIEPPSSQYCGAAGVVPILGNAGDKVSLSFTSTKSVDFFVFATMNDYLTWNRLTPCSFDKAKNVLIKQHNVNSYSFDMTLPSNVPIMVFLYTSYALSNADISVTQTVANYMTTAGITAATITNLQTFEVSAPTSQPSQLPQANTDWIVPVAIVAILAVGFILFRLMSNKMKPA